MKRQKVVIQLLFQHLELKPDLTKIKDIELLQKLINELKDAQNSSDDPKTGDNVRRRKSRCC